ncbi:CGGC domain-containing protein [Desulforhopalus sp. IMCC35007]|uniref:CGGC domain-containing protein n=1 Tax=Desulforhopalus sp. IMCC35007 TaxID=2569543 RepID=UPI00197ABBC6|nr:CGGC domain-containing protein [Desulforhopalus sp. IMCC35007]
MIKIAILVREETTHKCTGRGCLKSFNGKTESFARYQGTETELVGFFHSGGDLDYKLKTMKEAGVNVIHVSTCMRAKYDDYEGLVQRIGKDFDVIGYTHGSAEGKTRPTISVTGKTVLETTLHKNDKL